MFNILCLTVNVKECLRRCVKTLTKHLNILLHTEIRWPSRGRLPNRVFELEDELQECFQENIKPHFANCFEDKKMAAEANLLSRHFSSYESVKQVTARS